jgi:hypothetical protein
MSSKPPLQVTRLQWGRFRTDQSKSQHQRSVSRETVNLSEFA